MARQGMDNCSKTYPKEEQKETFFMMLGRRLIDGALGPTGEVFEGGRGPNSVKYALKENEKGYGEVLRHRWAQRGQWSPISPSKEG